MDVRYGDLDPQGHLNSASYLTFVESARLGYLTHLGLWPGGSFYDIGVILADAHLTYIAQIMFRQKIQVGARVTRLGNKSLAMEHCLVEAGSEANLATCKTVLVAYDYRTDQTISIPDHWRQTIAAFEELTD